VTLGEEFVCRSAARKTKLRCCVTTRHLRSDVLIGQNEIETVDDFTYLGRSTNNQRAMSRYHEINSILGIATATFTFNQRPKIYGSQDVNINMRLDNLDVLSISPCGCKTWHLISNQETKLDAFDSRCIRTILGIKCSDFNVNAGVTTICQRRLDWLFHVPRLPLRDFPTRCSGGRQKKKPAQNKLAPDHPERFPTSKQELEGYQEDGCRPIYECVDCVLGGTTRELLITSKYMAFSGI